MTDAEAALQGARDIVAERVTDDAEARARIRRLFWQKGVMRTRSPRWQSSQRREVQGLLRLVGADRQRALAPRPRHAARRSGGNAVLSHPTGGGGRACHARAHVRQGLQPRCRPGAPGGARRLQAPAVALHGDRDARGGQAARGCGRDRGLCRRTSDNCCWRRHWVRSACWPSIPGLRTGCKTVVLDAQGQLRVRHGRLPGSGPATATSRPVTRCCV